MEMLKKLRDRIDWLDTQIASLLNERMKAADQIGRVKQANHQEVTDHSREKFVLDNVETIVQHPTLKANISNIYKEIMQESRTAQQFFQHLSLPFRRIGILGLGLMGGSICKGIKTKDPSVQICTLFHQDEDDALAKEEEWIDQVYTSVAEFTQNCDLIILAAPISTVIGLAEDIKRQSQNQEKLIVIDIASVKNDIVSTFEKISSEKIEFISTHPMAGKESKGFANSQATLFVNCPWIVVPHKKNTADGIESVEEFIRYLGSKPLLSETDVHDRQAALISHLPSILSKLYFDFVNSIDPESMKIAGPGFQSFTRLAHKNRELMKDIKHYNRKDINCFMDQWVEFIKHREP